MCNKPFYQPLTCGRGQCRAERAHPGSVRARHNVPKAKAKARGRRSGDAMPIPVNDGDELKASAMMDVESMEESLYTLCRVCQCTSRLTILKW